MNTLIDQEIACCPEQGSSSISKLEDGSEYDDSDDDSVYFDSSTRGNREDPAAKAKHPPSPMRTNKSKALEMLMRPIRSRRKEKTRSSKRSGSLSKSSLALPMSPIVEKDSFEQSTRTFDMSVDTASLSDDSCSPGKSHRTSNGGDDTTQSDGNLADRAKPNLQLDTTTHAASASGIYSESPSSVLSDGTRSFFMDSSKKPAGSSGAITPSILFEMVDSDGEDLATPVRGSNKQRPSPPPLAEEEVKKKSPERSNRGRSLEPSPSRNRHRSSSRSTTGSGKKSPSKRGTSVDAEIERRGMMKRSKSNSLSRSQSSRCLAGDDLKALDDILKKSKSSRSLLDDFSFDLSGVDLASKTRRGGRKEDRSVGVSPPSPATSQPQVNKKEKAWNIDKTNESSPALTFDFEDDVLSTKTKPEPKQRPSLPRKSLSCRDLMGETKSKNKMNRSRSQEDLGSLLGKISSSTDGRRSRRSHASGSRTVVSSAVDYYSSTSSSTSRQKTRPTRKGWSESKETRKKNDDTAKKERRSRSKSKPRLESSPTSSLKRSGESRRSKETSLGGRKPSSGSLCDLASVHSTKGESRQSKEKALGGRKPSSGSLEDIVSIYSTKGESRRSKEKVLGGRKPSSGSLSDVASVHSMKSESRRSKEKALGGRKQSSGSLSDLLSVHATKRKDGSSSASRSRSRPSLGKRQNSCDGLIEHPRRGGTRPSLGKRQASCDALFEKPRRGGTRPSLGPRQSSCATLPCETSSSSRSGSKPALSPTGHRSSSRSRLSDSKCSPSSRRPKSSRSPSKELN